MSGLRNAAVYVRCSTDLPGQEKSLGDQLVAIRREAERQGIQILPQLIYSDYAKTGRLLSPRTGLLQLMEDARSGKLEDLGVQVLICWAFDRFARNATDALPLQKQLADYGIRIYSVRERTSAEGRAGRWSFVFSSFMAEIYSERLSQLNKRSHRSKAELGHFWSITAPYGYKKTGTKYLAINPLEVDTVQLIYRLFLAGTSIRRIAIHLREKKIARRNGTLNWNRFMVRLILKQDANIGIRIFKGCIYEKGRPVPNPDFNSWIVVPAAHPPIISVDDFIQTQNMLKDRLTIRNFNVFKRKEYLLSGINILKCGECGGSYNGQPSSANKGYNFYGCRNRLDSSRKPCQNDRVRTDDIDPLILKGIAAFANDPIKLNAAWKKHRDVVMTRVLPIKEKLLLAEKELTLIRKRMDRLVKAYDSEVISLDRLKARNAELEPKEARLAMLTRDLRQEVDSAANGLNAEVATLLGPFREGFDNLDIQARKQLLSQLIKRIVIHSAHDISVEAHFMPPGVPIHLPAPAASLKP